MPSIIWRGSPTLAAAPASTGVLVAGTLIVSVSTTSATMQVMLSGPPPRRARSMSWRVTLSGSAIVARASRSASSFTTPDKPSEQSR